MPLQNVILERSQNRRAHPPVHGLALYRQTDLTPGDRNLGRAACGEAGRGAHGHSRRGRGTGDALIRAVTPAAGLRVREDSLDGPGGVLLDINNLSVSLDVRVGRVPGVLFFSQKHQRQPLGSTWHRPVGW